MTGKGTTRRSFLRGAAGTAAVAGATGQVAGQESLQIDLVDYAYEPGTDDPARITTGTTVNFVWATSTHNIIVDSQPEGANWQGHESIEDAGFEYSHTFETEGTYEFHCGPHQSLGMVGTIEVGAQAGGTPGSGSTGPSVPDAAKTIGVGLFAGMLVTLGLAYSLLKYGGSPDETTE